MDWREDYFKTRRCVGVNRKEVKDLLELTGVPIDQWELTSASTEPTLPSKYRRLSQAFIGNVKVEGSVIHLEGVKFVLGKRYLLMVELGAEECAESPEDGNCIVDVSMRELLNFLGLYVECRPHKPRTTKFVRFISALLMDFIKHAMKELSTPGVMYQRWPRAEIKSVFEELLLVVRFLIVTLCAGTNIRSPHIASPLPSWAKITCPSRFSKPHPAPTIKSHLGWDEDDGILECEECKGLMISGKTRFAEPVYFGCGSLRHWGYAHISVLWNYFGNPRRGNGCTFLAQLLITLTRERESKLVLVELELLEALLQLIYGGLQILVKEAVSPLFPACMHVLKALQCYCTVTEQSLCLSRVKLFTSTLKSLESIMKACNVVPVSCVESMIRTVEDTITKSFETALGNETSFQGLLSSMSGVP